MADLTGTTPADTYKGLLQINDYTDGIAGNTGSNALAIQDGAGNATALAVSTDNVGIGTASPSAPLHIKTSNTTDTLLLESTGDSISNAPDLILYRNSATPADADNLGIIKFRGVNDGTVGVNRSDIDYALIQSEITDASNNVEKGSLSFWTRGVGSVDRRMTIDSDGNVGIGTTSPNALLTLVSDVTATDAGQIRHEASQDSTYFTQIGTRYDYNKSFVIDNRGDEIITYSKGPSFGLHLDSNESDLIRMSTGGSESLRIDSAGNVGIGTTDPKKILHIAQAVNGDSEVTFHNNDATSGSSSQTKSLSFAFAQTGSSATRSVGAMIRAGKEQEWTSSASSQDGFLSLYTTKGTLLQEAMRIDSDGNVTPGTDDAQDFGSATKRWDDIYATNGTIDTSDRELKQDIEELSEAETRVAQACKGLLRKYRWKSSVAEKGDDARIHFGIMAQDLEAAFAAEGLDAGRYGMFIKNTWWEADRVIPAVEAVEAIEAVYDEEGNEVSPAVEAVEAQPERTELDIFNNIEDAPEGATEVTQRGVRYTELLAFIIAAA